jgi:hypothetical protein
MPQQLPRLRCRHFSPPLSPTLDGSIVSVTSAIESTLNNSLLVPPVSHHHFGGNAAIEPGSENEGAKKPQLPDDHPQIATCAAQHRVRLICERVFEPVPIEFSVCLVWVAAKSGDAAATEAES